MTADNYRDAMRQRLGVGSPPPPANVQQQAVDLAFRIAQARAARKAAAVQQATAPAYGPVVPAQMTDPRLIRRAAGNRPAVPAPGSSLDPAMPTPLTLEEAQAGIQAQPVDQPPPVATNQNRMRGTGSGLMQRPTPASDPSSPLFQHYRAALESGLSPQEATTYAVNLQLEGDPIMNTIAPVIGDVAMAGAEVVGDAAGAVVDSPIGKGIGWANEQYNKGYQWNVGRVGDDMLGVANGKNEPGLSNPWFYVDASILHWSTDPANKDRINAVATEGLDLDGDGTADVTGGQAVYMLFNAELHPGFFDGLITSLAMDPLFAASFIAPAAGGARAGTGVARETAVMANLSKTERVLAAADRALAGITKAGDIGNTIADLPIVGPVWVAGKAAQGVSKIPKAGPSIRRGIGWLAAPDARTAARIETDAARDVAQDAQRAAAQLPPVQTVASAGPPGAGVVDTGAARTTGPGTGQAQPGATMAQDASTGATQDIGPGVVRPTVPAASVAPGTAPRKGVEPLPGESGDWVPYGDGQLVNRASGEIVDAPVPPGGAWQPIDNGRVVNAETGEIRPAAVADAPRGVVETPPVAVAEPPVVVSPATTQAVPPPAERYGAGKPVKQPFLLEETPKAGTTWKRAIYDADPAAYQRVKAKLDDTAYQFEQAINSSTSRFDRKLLEGEWAATLKKAARDEGVEISIPWERGPSMRDPGKAKTVEARIDRVIFEPDQTVTTADRAELYKQGLIRKDAPRPELGDEIRTGTLNEGGRNRVTVTAANGERITYTNRALNAMPETERAKVADLAVKQQTEAYNRYQRIQSIRADLYETASVAPGIVQDAAVGAVTDQGTPAPVGPSSPKAPDVDRLRAMFRNNDIDEPTYTFLSTVYGTGADAKRGWDVLADVIDRKAQGLDLSNPWAMRRAQNQIADEFAVAMRELTGTRVPVEVKRSLAGKGFRKFLGGLDTLSAIAREGGIYNVVTGPRGWAQDVISNFFKLTWEGNLNAAMETLFPNQLIKVMRGESDALTTMMNRLGVDEPSSLRVMDKFDVGGLDKTRMTLHETVNKVTRAPEGSVRDRVARIMTEPFSSSWIADARSAHENLARRALMLDEVEQALPKAGRDFRAMGREVAQEYGVLPSSFDAYVYDLGDQFSPADVKRVIRELGTDAGLMPEAVDEFSRRMSSAWRNTASKIRSDALKETKRILLSYERTNLDNFLSKFVFYHYWMSRSLVSYTKLALHNPELAAVWFRAWNEIGDRAEREGYPKSLVGYIRYLGNTTSGFYHAYNPMQFFVPFDVLRQDPYADTGWEQLTQFAMVNPIIQGVAAVVGLTDQAPDLLNTYAVRNMTVAALDYLRGQGWLGDVRLQEDWYDNAVRAGYEFANEIVAATGAPFAEDRTFLSRNVYNAEVISYVLRDVVAEETGIPFSETDPRWLPGGTAFEVWADAKKAYEAGDPSPLWDEAFTRWSETFGKNAVLNAALPGGSRLRLAERDQEMVLANEGYDAIDTVEGPTPEQQGAMDNRSAVKAGSPEDFDLTAGISELNRLGTEDGRRGYTLWNDIAYGDFADAGESIQIGDQVFYGWQINKMSDDQREDLADLWLAQYAGVPEQVEDYRGKRDDFLAEHPEVGDFKEYQNGVYNYKGGPKQWRTMYARKDSQFGAEMERKREQFRNQGKTGAVLEAELDDWSASAAAYKLVNRFRDDIYAESMTPVVPDYGFDSGQDSGSTAKKSTPKDPMEQVEDTIVNWQTKMVDGIAAMRADGYDVTEADVLAGNPWHRDLFARYGIPQSIPDDVLLYLGWNAAQPAGANTAVSDYLMYLIMLGQRAA